MGQVWHYDGTSGIRHDAELEAHGTQFRVRKTGDTEWSNYDWTDLVSRGERGDAHVYGLKSRRGWQIGLSGDFGPNIVDHLPRPEKFGGWIDRIGLGPAALASIAASALAIVIVVKSPEIIAPLVPASVEQNLGDAMVGDFGGRFCSTPNGNKALAALVSRIEPNNKDLKVHVANINMVNAVALPGNHVIIFRGLLQQAQSPDEVAGVLGHEIGHVRHRDVMQAMLRQMGLSLLLGGVSGNSGGYANTIMSASYTRTAESKADEYAIGAMQKSNVSPQDTANFFARMAAVEHSISPEAQNVLKYLSTHPDSASREKKFMTSIVKGAQPTPVIDPEQWRALTDMCKDDPKMKRGGDDFF
jgi:beta-barrel assembly-enhancing protease